MFHYTINPDSDVPIYRQLVNQINAQIRSGALKTGTQLPTVRELADRLHLSCGTVKHVYDTLQEMGDVEMSRRRGTFVKYVRRDTDSRKQQAMNAIDHMIRKLSDLNFSPAEIQIFLNLKMREWGLKWSGIRIAVVTEYTEAAGALRRQLSEIGNVEVTLYSLSQLREYPYNVDEQSDVILATAEDAQKLSMVLPDADKIIRIAFRTETEAVARIASHCGKQIGLVCETEAFAALVCKQLPAKVSKHLRVIAPDTEWPDTAKLDLLVIADGCEPVQPLSCKTVIPFACRLDEGSMLYLEERISKLRDERQLWPNALRF